LAKSLLVGVLVAIGAAISALVLLILVPFVRTLPPERHGSSWDWFLPITINLAVPGAAALAAGVSAFVWQWRRARQSASG